AVTSDQIPPSAGQVVCPRHYAERQALSHTRNPSRRERFTRHLVFPWEDIAKCAVCGFHPKQSVSAMQELFASCYITTHVFSVHREGMNRNVRSVVVKLAPIQV